MQCPICKKDLEIKNKKIGENEAGEAIYNEFAICRDCKKQWNLATSDRPLLKYAEGQEESREKVRPRPKKKRPEEAKPVHAIDNSSTRIISDEEDELKITAPDLSTPEGEKEQTYSNIPPKHVREKREQEMRENYQNMLDEEDDDDERHFPVALVVILIFLIIAAAAFAGYWFFLK